MYTICEQGGYVIKKAKNRYITGKLSAPKYVRKRWLGGLEMLFF